MTNAELIAWQRREQSPVEKALRRAYQLGQTYWQQADSESYKQNRLSDDTRQKFESLVAEMIATPPAPTTEPTAKPIAGLTEEELLAAIQSIGKDGHGRISLTYESGARDIDRPTWAAERLSYAITRALAEKNGLAVQGGE